VDGDREIRAALEQHWAASAACDHRSVRRALPPAGACDHFRNHAGQPGFEMSPGVNDGDFDTS
jgi:hypothetical protein